MSNCDLTLVKFGTGKGGLYRNSLTKVVFDRTGSVQLLLFWKLTSNTEALFLQTALM